MLIEMIDKRIIIRYFLILLIDFTIYWIEILDSSQLLMDLGMAINVLLMAINLLSLAVNLLLLAINLLVLAINLLLLAINSIKSHLKLHLKPILPLISYFYFDKCLIICSTISFATSSLFFRSKLVILLFLSMIVILFVAFLFFPMIENPAPSSFKEFRIIASRFFFFNLILAFSSSLSVSNAKPTKYCFFCFIFPNSNKISLVGIRFSSSFWSFFLIF